MSGVLSQKEIDELLQAITSGEDDLQETSNEVEAENSLSNVRSYNFKTANKFPKEQMRTLLLIYENYAGRLATFLSGKLRALCEVEVVSIEEQSFSEFNNSIPSPVILAIAKMPPLQGNILFEVSPTISYEIISRLFGGIGQDNDSNKQFTEIELSILERIVRSMLKLVDDSWDKVIKIETRYDRIETSTQFAQIVESNEPIAIITLNVAIGEISDTINICIPHIAIQPVLKKLAMKKWYSDSAKNKEFDVENDKMNSQLSNTFLTLHSVFDNTKATIKEVMSLQVGDVIRIDHNVNKPITVKIEHMSKIKGMVGTHGSKYAVKITDIFREDDD
ncbi:MAG: flagellar motor switch protein FliM [Clostridiales bacterium]|nr:flagellar motor switch protein FliM [Clostridiales bacterium]